MHVERPNWYSELTKDKRLPEIKADYTPTEFMRYAFCNTYDKTVSEDPTVTLKEFLHEVRTVRSMCEKILAEAEGAEK
jgi:hypothetical protein